MDKIKIREAIIVEGKYDQIKLSNLFDTLILTTNGFDIYRNKKRLEMLKLVAKKNGVIILTDSDSAGFRIRNYLRNCFGDIPVKNAYIPEIEGKEKRKETASKEGLLGVEGISDEVIVNAILTHACKDDTEHGEKVTKADFYSLGLTGSAGSSGLRAQLSREMNLPVKISANRLLELVNTMYNKEEFEKIIGKLHKK